LRTIGFKELRVLPSSTRKELNEFAESVDKDTIGKLDNESKMAVMLATDSEEYINPNDLGKRENYKTLNNKPEYEGTPLVSKNLVINKRVKSSKAGLMKLSQKVGIGSNIHIPLWHSGFWITYMPMVDEEIINLELELVSEIARIGKETNALIFSNYNVLFADVILKHFKKKIVDSSLALEDGQDILDYININDIYTIALFMAKSMYPHGIHVVIPCSNTTILDDKGIPKCSYKARLKIDLNEVFWVDESKLTVEHKQLMSKKTPRSVTIDDVIKYQDTLPTSGEIEKSFTTDNGDITIVLGPVSVNEYLESGRLFIEDLRDKAIEIIKNNKNVGDENDAERLILSSIFLNVYSHYIKKIPIDDAVITDLADKKDALNMLTSNKALSNDIMDMIKSYIDNSLISIVGVPKFKCPVCSSEQTTKELIPLAVYEYFFILLHSRFEKVNQKLK